MSGFVHLHVHSEFSLLDGACRIKKLVERAKNLGQRAVAITDHGVMYGVIDFFKAATKVGIRPIVGCEVYVAPRSRHDKVHEFDSESRHLVLLCENNTGYQNLSYMVSKSFTEGFYKKPRVDEELLDQHHEGIIALSACLAGEIPKRLVRDDYEGAKAKALRYQEIFGRGNFFLELQDHGIREQKYTNPLIAKIASETGIPLVATNDCHYLTQKDHKMHNILLCIQTNHTIEDENRMEFSSDQFYLKSEDEMRALFSAYPEAISNTGKIAERCNVTFDFGNTKLPHFEVPDGKDHFEYFKENCYAGLYKNYGAAPEKALTDRLEYELQTIKKMGYVDYYLIVHDFVRHAKSAGISVGPGRGSGAGSLAAYCIGITGIDPIKYNLLFERFLNPERVSMPDFDIDFCYERRQEVIDYVIDKYGADRVAQIITFGTMAARGAVRDVGRTLAMPYSEVDKIAKLIPMELGITLKKALAVSLELKNAYADDPKTKELIDMAMEIEGMPRHASTHAAGVVITEKPVNYYVPLAKNDEAIVTQYTMTTLEELGLLKMDFLGLRNLTVLDHAQKMIQKSDESFSLERIKEDKKVFEMFAQGSTDGVFQFESAGMKSVLSQLKPENIEDLIAVISLYRPGPMDSIPKYVENRHNPEKISYLHPLLSNILDVTYGCIVYQEQVMQIFRTLAGYSLGRADIVRRAMSKKKADVMEHEKNIFINGLVGDDGKIEVDGCIRRGVSKEIAEEIFSQMESFASYAFNKSHAAAYAFISYQTAWLKYYYPKEYMAALLTSVLDNTNKVALYILECERMNIKVLPPHVNESETGFTVSGESIRFGLLAIKSLGEGFIGKLLAERSKNGKFKSFYDFCKRVHGREANRRAIESLIKSGALDNLGSNRHQMLSAMGAILDALDEDKKKNLEGQLGFFDSILQAPKSDEPEMPDLEELGQGELLALEKQTTGMYLSGHPMSEYAQISRSLGAAQIGNILAALSEHDHEQYQEDLRVTVVAIISSVRLKATKSNSMMAFVAVEDLTGTINAIVFPKILNKYSYLLQEGGVVQINGRVNAREEDEPKLVCDEILPVNKENTAAQTKKEESKDARNGLYIKLKSQEDPAYAKAELLLSIFEGSTPVYFFFSDTKKLMLAPRKLWIDANHVLLDELKRALGDENVAFKR